MATYYKKVKKGVNSSVTNTQLSAARKTEIEGIVNNFITYFKAKHT